MTNHDSCLDGLSYNEGKKLKDEIAKFVKRSANLCSNALAMITQMTNSDIAARLLVEEKKNRKLLAADTAFEVDNEGFPTWMTSVDRRLLQGSVNADVVVAADGSGNYRTIGAAVAAAPSGGGKRFIIRIKAGTYSENVLVPSSKSKLMFVGDGAGATVITGSRSVGGGSTTFNSATVGKRVNTWFLGLTENSKTLGPRKSPFARTY